MSSKDLMFRAQRVAEAAAARKTDNTRHRCFVSYHVDDLTEVETFLNDFGTEFIPRSVGVTAEDDFVDSTDEDYIKRRIREEYMTGTTVTIVLLGSCTWGRMFVDWEISSSLRDDSSNTRNGLLVYPLPSMNNSARLPARVADNWTSGDQGASYVRFMSYPSSTTIIRNEIEAAFGDRMTKGEFVENGRALQQANTCP